MSAVIRQGSHEAQKACESARSHVSQFRLEHEQRAILMECDVDRLRAAESEAERRHEKAVAQERRKAETIQSVGDRALRLPGNDLGDATRSTSTMAK